MFLCSKLALGLLEGYSYFELLLIRVTSQVRIKVFPSHDSSLVFLS